MRMGRGHLLGYGFDTGIAIYHGTVPFSISVEMPLENYRGNILERILE